MELLNENISHDDLKKYIKELYNYIAKELSIDVPPRIFLRRDKANAEDIFGKTGGYDPDNGEIHLYITDRHPKDVLRSFAHELIHHMQKLQGLDTKVNIDLIHRDEAYAQHDEGLREMERQAFEEGNMLFRAWTDSKKIERKNIMAEDKKVPKGVVKKAHKIAKKVAKGGGADEPYAVGMAVAKKQAGLKEKQKPDFLDLDKDGDTSEPMKKAAKDKEKKEMKEEKDDAPFEGGKEVKTPSGKHKAKKLAIKGKKEAEKQAKDDMQSRLGKNVNEQGLGGQGEEQENLQEAKEQEIQHPYPQLLQEKPRLMQEAFNKKEELVYQELLRRFIKK